MRFWTMVALVASMGFFAGSVQAEDADHEQIRKWCERVHKELEALERKMTLLDGSDAPLSKTDEERAKAKLRKLLMELTDRVHDLSKRIAALEENLPKAIEEKPVEEPQPAIADKDAAEAADADKGALPAFLKDPDILKKIPQPPAKGSKKAKSSKVKFSKTKGGLKKANIKLPEAQMKGPMGKLGCESGAEIFLLQGTPIIGIELITVNKQGFLFKGEKHVHINIDGNVFTTDLKWEGQEVISEDEVFYVEKINFGMGLPAFLGMVDGIRVTISIGTYELRISGPAATDLRDICSCLHPDRIDALR